MSSQRNLESRSSISKSPLENISKRKIIYASIPKNNEDLNINQLRRYRPSSHYSKSDFINRYKIKNFVSPLKDESKESYDFPMRRTFHKNNGVITGAMFHPSKTTKFTS